MQIKVKSLSLLLIAAAGLLLGGNVSAADNTASSISINDASALIEQLRQKINSLAQQLQSVQNMPEVAVTIVAAPVLTQAELDGIEVQVNRITGEVARLKIEVGVFVTLRQIQEKTALLNAQIEEATGIPSTVVSAAQSQISATPTGNQQGIESQIARLKQQIAELNQELVAKQAAGQAVAATDTTQPICAGGACPVPVETQNNAPVPVTIATTAPSGSNGFWQSVGDFFKKLFTF